jgi:hypothetical protein
MAPVLRLIEDIFANAAVMSLPAQPRMLFAAHGAVALADRLIRDDEAFGSEAALKLEAGAAGATLWRWELGQSEGDRISGEAAEGVVSREKLAARLDTLPSGPLLLRGDSVAFPPGGCAYLHRHQGPGIRCLSEGGIRIDTRGHSLSYGPGGAWYESGPEPVFAEAADRPTRFIRVMILPRSCLGKSSIEYVNPEDKLKPKVQTYKIYVDMPIELPTRRA